MFRRHRSQLPVPGLAPKGSQIEQLLGEGLRRQQSGDPKGAEQCYRKVLELDATSAPATHFLGVLAHQAGREDEALNLIRESISRSPNTASFHSNLGTVYGQIGKAEEAAASFRAALRLNPNSIDAHKNLALALESLDRFDEASAEYRAALRISADAPDVQAHLTRVLARSGEPPEPAAFPGAEGGEASAAALQTLASVYERQGRLECAVSAYRRLFEIRPSSPAPHSALLFLLLHSASIQRDELFREHREWAGRHAPPLCQHAAGHRRDRTVARPLRVGYVSPDFRRHSNARFSEPLIRAHDRRQFTAICYSDCRHPDDTTRRFRSMANEWRDTSAIDTSQLCHAVEQDRIDILVDLCGHMGGNRMPVFALKPAPVQITYLYPHSTGLPTMDGHISDAWLHPDGHSEQFHTERVMRIPRTGWCCQPPADAPPISGLPALATGRVTFGSLNRLLKVTPVVLDVWARLLERVPKSQLLLLVESESGGARLRVDFARRGIKESRICPVLRAPHRAYLEHARRIDIALDTFPYNGATTTYDMLWMGLPIITMAGEMPASRMGLGLLSNLGLTDLVAGTPDEYVRIASELAENLDRLRELRSTLRERVRCSVLVDERGTTARIEEVYQRLWADWCERRTSPISA